MDGGENEGTEEERQREHEMWLVIRCTGRAVGSEASRKESELSRGEALGAGVGT